MVAMTDYAAARFASADSGSLSISPIPLLVDQLKAELISAADNVSILYIYHKL
jgi:hypothetical protein